MYFSGSSLANIGGSYVFVLASGFTLSAMWYVALKLALLALSENSSRYRQLTQIYRELTVQKMMTRNSISSGPTVFYRESTYNLIHCEHMVLTLHSCGPWVVFWR